MTKYLLLLVSVMPAALAQILLKQASNHPLKSLPWLGYMMLSVASYGVAFVLYSIVLKYFPISMASPILTIGVMLIILCFGWFIGEEIHMRRAFGFVIGIISIYFIIAN
jgi:drug/metabolite transporter (DMT)-like permease